ncbi:MAG: hypothetical protein NTZ30_13715 [Planctomycetota bacterium]|nr:hypothetical protein [Planctomycetota bacterium]
MRLDITLCLGLTFGLAYSHSSEPIKPEQFNKLHSIIKPNLDEEKFMQIPWMIDLWEARKKAASEDRPILLWEMDGHPLGCV